MERIKKALERAGQDRLTATDVLRQTSQHQGIPVRDRDVDIYNLETISSLIGFTLLAK